MRESILETILCVVCQCMLGDRDPNLVGPTRGFSDADVSSGRHPTARRLPRGADSVFRSQLNLKFYFASSALRAFTLLLHFSYASQPYHLNYTIHCQQEKAQQHECVTCTLYLHYMYIGYGGLLRWACQSSLSIALSSLQLFSSSENKGLANFCYNLSILFNHN